MFRISVRRLTAAAGLVVGFALVAPPPAAAMPWFDTALTQAWKVADLFGSFLGGVTESFRRAGGDEGAAIDPDGMR